MYELLTGELPFGGVTPQAQLTRRLYDTPTPVRKLRPAVPPALEQVVAKMLERSAQDRYRSGAEVVAALASLGVAKNRSGRNIAIAAAGAVALAIVAAVVMRRTGVPTLTNGAVAPRSIAVLPFANVGTDASNEYYGDGIADELAGSLAKVPGLRVAARSSAFQFKGRNIAAREIAEKLGVDAVVEGSVRPMGGRIRIAAQLVNASDGLGLWSANYDRPAAEAFDVQATITDAIATALGVDRSPSTRPRVVNSRAYDAFLQGRWHWAKRNRQGFEAAIKYFQVALHEDTTYARAWAGLGDAYSLLGAYGWSEPAVVFEQARTAANRAVVLDSTLADAHTALGLIHLFYDRDWNGSRVELETARRLDPKNGEARLFYGWYLLAMHRDSAAVDSLRSAVRDEPVSLVLNLRFGSMLMFSARFPEAKKQLAHVLELSTDFPLANLDLARIAVVERQPAAAATYLARAPERVSSYGSGVYGVVLAKSGRTAEARTEAERLQHGYGSNESALAAAHVYTALGDVDKAFDSLDRAYDRHESMLFAARSDPLLAPLRGDSRWAGFIARMKFP
jgi:TolB-like protein/Tfp pilus assembly protein PilF